MNGSDPSWWQAHHEAGDTIGLVPSQDLEERRKCFVEKRELPNLSKWSSCCGAGVSKFTFVVEYYLEIRLKINNPFWGVWQTLPVFLESVFFFHCHCAVKTNKTLIYFLFIYSKQQQLSLLLVASEYLMSEGIENNKICRYLSDAFLYIQWCANCTEWSLWKVSSICCVLDLYKNKRR